MYLLFGILFAICVIFFIINFFRRKCIIKKICCMDFCEKLSLLNKLTSPFGFVYFPSQDIMTSTKDAWQKKFGYRSLYDRSAPHFNMVFDCEPVYFEYENKTWLIEFWKGQYGINIGAEIGIYKADRIICPAQYNNTVFHQVTDQEMLPLSMELNYKGQPLFSICKTHWWLTGFRIGSYCQPKDLTLEATLTFPNEEMLECFVQSMKRLGYADCELCICEHHVTFTFSLPHTYQPCTSKRLTCKISQWENQIFCKLFITITKPFICTMDRILFLYFFLPSAFRHLLLFKKSHKQKCKKRNFRRCCKKCSKQLKCEKCSKKEDR